MIPLWLCLLEGVIGPLARPSLIIVDDECTGSGTDVTMIASETKAGGTVTVSSCSHAVKSYPAEPPESQL